MDDRLSHRTAARTLITALATVALAACQHIDPVPLDPADVAHAFEARSLAELGLRDFVEQQTHSRVPTWPPQPLDLDTATLAALYFQPSLDVARAQRDVARGAIATAGQRPNPTLLLAPELSTNPGTAASPWTSALHLDWPIETAHKRKHRIARADALASASERALSAEAWRVRLALRLAFADAEIGRRRVASLRDRGAAEGRLADLLEARVGAGAASRADALPARSAWLATQVELADAERSLAAARAQLAATIGVPTRALDGTELADLLDTPAASLDEEGDVEVRRHALLERADVLAALDAYAASEAQLRLELAKQWPDLHLGNSYQFDQGQNKWGLTLALDLPVMNRNEGPIAEAVAARGEAAARFSALQAQVIGELDQASLERDGAREQLRRADAVVAEQRRAWQRARAARAEGATDLPAEVAAEIEFRLSETLRLDAQLALERARANLEAVRQAPLFADDAVDRSPREARADTTP